MRAMKNKAFSATKFQKELGARIRELREQRHMTQEKLAEHIDMSRSFIGPIERGEKLPSILTIGKIAHAFDLPTYQLFMIPSDITPRQQSLQEIVSYLPKLSERDARLVLSVCREQLKEYSSESHKH